MAASLAGFALLLSRGVQANSPKQAVAAEASTSKAKLSKLKKQTDAKPAEEDIDQEITNARMRATSGSKNLMSLSASLNYQGGQVGDPFGDRRPNLLGDAETEDSTAISGNVGGRFRWSKNDSLSLGIGIGVLTPFQGDVDANETQFNISNPGLTYSRVFAFAGTQNIADLGVTFGTAQAWRQVELQRVYNASYTVLKSFKENRYTAGVSVAAAVFDYNDSSRGGEDNRNAYSLGFYPFAEYAFSDKVQLRSVFGYFNFRQRRKAESESPINWDWGQVGTADLNMERTVNYQSVGINLVLSRDINIYPNIQFLPGAMAVNKTNVALSSTINL